MIGNWCGENLRNCQAWIDSGLKLTTVSDECAKYYDAAVRQVTSFLDYEPLGGIEGTLTNMMTCDSTCVMGRAFCFGLDLLGSRKSARIDSKFAADIESLVSDADKLNVTEREKMHVQAVKQLADGHMDKAADIWELILREYPTDLHAIKYVTTAHLFLGNVQEIRDCVLRVLPHWNSHMPLYSHLKGMLAYGFEENEQYSQAEQTAQEALSLNRNDAWATHAIAHCMEMNGRSKEGVRFMEKYEQDWRPLNHLACHNYWHWAVFYIDSADYESAMSIFDNEIQKRIKSKAMFPIVDACSILYRLQLEGSNVGSRWEQVYDVCRPFVDQHAQAYNDTMLAMTFLGIKDYDTVKIHKESIENYIKNSTGVNKVRTEKYGVPICEAVTAFDQGQYGVASDLLYPIKDNFVLLGGSNAQRDVYAQLLLHSCINSDKPDHRKLASKLLVERESYKPKSELTERLRAKLAKV